MITGVDASIQEKILTALRESDIVFELTGSRYFECPREDSDYDFFTKYTPETATWLKQLDFKNERMILSEIIQITLAKSTYDDLATEVVFAHVKGNIHVQLIKPSMMEAKRIVQEVFKSARFLRPSRRDWDMALTIAKRMLAIH